MLLVAMVISTALSLVLAEILIRTAMGPPAQFLYAGGFRDAQRPALWRRPRPATIRDWCQQLRSTG